MRAVIILVVLGLIVACSASPNPHRCRRCSYHIWHPRHRLECCQMGFNQVHCCSRSPPQYHGWLSTFIPQPTTIHPQPTPTHHQPTPIHHQPTPIHHQPAPIHSQPINNGLSTTNNYQNQYGGEDYSTGPQGSDILESDSVLDYDYDAIQARAKRRYRFN